MGFHATQSWHEEQRMAGEFGVVVLIRGEIEL